MTVCFCASGWLQLFREWLLEKVHTTIPKGIVGGFDLLFFKKFQTMAQEAKDVICEC